MIAYFTIFINIMGESQCLAFCGDCWKFRDELPVEGLFLKNFVNGEEANVSLPFFVGGDKKANSN
jgi:hypothetical protein